MQQFKDDLDNLYLAFSSAESAVELQEQMNATQSDIELEFKDFGVLEVGRSQINEDGMCPCGSGELFDYCCRQKLNSKKMYKKRNPKTKQPNNRPFWQK